MSGLLIPDSSSSELVPVDVVVQDCQVSVIGSNNGKSKKKISYFSLLMGLKDVLTKKGEDLRILIEYFIASNT